MPSFRTFYDWMEAHPSLAQQYARARDVGLDVMADECIALADVCREGVRTRKTVTADGKVEIETVTSDMIERAKLQFQARQWYLSKLAPKRYGDQQAAGGVGAVQINLVVMRAGADSAAGSLDLRAMIRGGEVRALPAPGGDDDAAS
jgi:hypothetical protein